MNGKPLVKSKLGWLGVATVIVGVADTVTQVAQGPAGALIPQKYVGPGLAVLGAVTTLLRLFTSQPITSTK